MARVSDACAVDWVAAYPPPRSLPLDQDGLRAYERAYYIGSQLEESGAPPVSFSTLILALLAGKDETSRWFAERAEEFGPRLEAIRAEKTNITDALLNNAAAWSGQPPSPKVSSDKHLLTASARHVLQNAEEWAQQVGGRDIGVRHLIASYVINPPEYHRAQMLRWQFNEARWRTAFFAWVAERSSWERWQDASVRPAPTRGLPAFAQADLTIRGAALAWPGDDGAMKIMERAARDHATRNDRWLRLQTVIFALVETARDDLAIRSAVLPVWTAVQEVEPQYNAQRAAYFGTAASEPTLSFDRLDISPRVLNALETARQLASASAARKPAIAGNAVTISAVHLAGALVSQRVDSDTELAALGLDPRQLRLALIDRVSTLEGDAEQAWREVLGEEESVLAGRPAELNSDEPEAVIRVDEEWKSDPLRIRRDVETFAALLASKDLEPPLSIGLFGPWGSGKTTFLKRLRRAVDQRAREAGASDGASPYVSNVVHVEFNAWHFSEDALVSSLVDTIFREISRYISGDDAAPGQKWLDRKRGDLESTRRKVEAAEAIKAAAQEAVSSAQTELEVNRREAARRQVTLHTVVDTAWQVARRELEASKRVKDSGVLGALGTTIRNTDELRSRVESVRTRPARLLSDLGPLYSALFAALVLVLPPVVAWVVSRIVQTGQAVQLVSSAAALLSVAGVWARAATTAVSKVDVALAEVVDTYERRVSAHPAVVQARENLDTALSSAVTAEAGLTAARADLAKAQGELASATLPVQMLKLVTTRIEDLSYEKELTTFSLARADLEKLSIILRDGRAQTAGPSGPERPVERVVLYIDDLDRCEPDDVVRVLQLVHMLLAFELFVVVVAVDERWVAESLRRTYQWLGKRQVLPTSSGNVDTPPDGFAGAVTPQDYLEKIFQIAFWLEPMTTSRAAAYVASLVRSPFRDPGTGPAPYAGQVGAPGAPAKVDITALELDYMRALAAFLGPSPRRVKRLVNAYRLIKARMSDSQLESFLTDREGDGQALRSGPYQIVIAMLTIATGAQTHARQILQELSGLDPRDTFEDAVSRLRDRDHRDYEMAAMVLDTLMQTQKGVSVLELRGWAQQVSRFLLRGPAEQVSRSGERARAPEPSAALRRETGEELGAVATS